MVEITGNHLKYLKECIADNAFTPIYVTGATYDGESAARQFILMGSDIISILRVHNKVSKPDKYEKVSSVAELRDLAMNVYIDDFLKVACNKEATRFILAYGGIDGAHHKMWVLDQVLRILNMESYESTIKEFENDGEYEWETGIAP